MFTTRSIKNFAANGLCASVTMLVLISGQSAQAQLASQSPLSVGGNVPGNLLLVPSVEFPTVDSVANLGTTYAPASTYTGYFDSEKCYRYRYYATETATNKNHFYPNSMASSHTCSGSEEWSGNYLNWATTQTIDPFRKALTGGYRVVDTASVTILEKARSDDQSSSTYFPNRSLSGTTLINNATPSAGSNFYSRISQGGKRMAFSRSATSPYDVGAANSLPFPTGTAYSEQTIANNTVYVLDVRVKVCDSSVGLESNCTQYGSNYKPEGLIQKYADRIRYSAFGFLNDHSMTRDGGALRAKQKFVGPNSLSFNSTDGWVQSDNSAKEWDPDTGVFAPDPDSADSASTTTVVSGAGASYVAANHAITNSGVINYINKFGQMTTKAHKNYDPVSELYYTAIRYLKNQGNVAEYTNLTGTALNRFELADGFPVITSWNDPIQYACQNNAILGIGDVNTHRDKNLPGSGTSGTDEPTKPTSVSGDTTVNVRTATAKAFSMEGLTIDTAAASWTGNRNNSAFMVGLAYDSHTKDLRPDATNPTLKGKQTVSTYWVDVREGQVLADIGSNQYWLAAKYGGFKVPKDFDPVAATSLPTGSWESDETLVHAGNNSRTRPENFYVASEASQMVASLTRAFANIVAESKGSASSLAANSTRLDTETRTFQAQFFSGSWGGELNAYSVDSDGELSASPVWTATGDMLTGITATPKWTGRKIKVNTGGSLVDFTWGTLNSTQRTALGSQKVVDYLRGERANEESYTNGVLRVRASIVGDIVNSTPLFIGAPNLTLHAGKSYAGGSTYAAWANNTARVNRTPVVYVGANDGMLHAFNATNGSEVFAFVPNTVIQNNLASYASPLYEHKFFVDGEPVAADIYDAATSTWKTVLVGSLGRGGPGIFALDVTDPANPALLWEKNATDIPELGKNIGRPVIAQVADGDWRVLLGNGPDSGAGAYLIAIALTSSGTVTTFAADTSTGNALSALLVRDSDGDSFADVAYGGDLEGALWKFSSPASTITATKLFQTESPETPSVAQPITAAPTVARNPDTSNLWVFFGTGKYLNEADITDKSVQTWYGIIDNGSGVTVTRDDLVSRDILVEANVAGVPVRVIEDGSSADLASADGWYIDLVSPTVNPTDGERGERMVVTNRFQGKALIGTSRIPEYNDPCEPGGTGFVMVINPFTGARLTTSFFDVNGDAISNDSDMYCAAGTCVPVSGMGFASSPNNPIFIENVMQVGLDSGDTDTIKTFGSSVEASRMSWRELFNN